MRFSAPTPAASTLAPSVAPPAQCSLPAMRGQVFEAVLGEDGLLAAPLPLPPGVRVRVVVVR
jgi:hypothetical protein